MATQSPTADEVKNLKDSDNATVHGVIKSLSPMKRGRTANVFHGNITDGETQLRVVGFQDFQRKKLLSYEKDSAAVALESCKIKRARDSSDYEKSCKVTKKVQC